MLPILFTRKVKHTKVFTLTLLVMLTYCDIPHTHVEEAAKYNNSLRAARHMDFLFTCPKSEKGSSCQAKQALPHQVF